MRSAVALEAAFLLKKMLFFIFFLPPTILIVDCQCGGGHPDGRLGLAEAGGAGLGWGGPTRFQTRFFPAPASERCPHPTMVSAALRAAVLLCVPDPP